MSAGGRRSRRLATGSLNLGVSLTNNNTTTMLTYFLIIGAFGAGYVLCGCLMSARHRDEFHGRGAMVESMARALDKRTEQVELLKIRVRDLMTRVEDLRIGGAQEKMRAARLSALVDWERAKALDSEQGALFARGSADVLRRQLAELTDFHGGQPPAAASEKSAHRAETQTVSGQPQALPLCGGLREITNGGGAS